MLAFSHIDILGYFNFRFISLNKIDEISNLEDAVLLAIAADEFLLEPLQTFCALEIERMVTVENVWSTLNAICHIPKVAASCIHVSLICLWHYFNFIKNSRIYLKPQ